jgi:hypothetical protein
VPRGKRDEYPATHSPSGQLTRDQPIRPVSSDSKRLMVKQFIAFGNTGDDGPVSSLPADERSFSAPTGGPRLRKTSERAPFVATERRLVGLHRAILAVS